MIAGRWRVELPTLGLIVATYAIWAFAGAILWLHAPIITLVVMTFAAAFHSSLVHEVCHGHPTRNALINEALIALPLGLIWPYRRFKALHLRHHDNERLTDPFDDPESFYLAELRFLTTSRAMLGAFAINNTMLGRVVLGPILGIIGLVLSDGRALMDGDVKVAKAWGVHLLGLVPVLALIFWFSIPLWLYFLTVVWISHGLIAIRTYAEHRWDEDPKGRSIIVTNCWLSALFLNNNLHAVHHEEPTVPWYNLPALYRGAPERWQNQNKGYVYRNYWQLFRAHAFRAKEPLVHPTLGRDASQK